MFNKIKKYKRILIVFGVVFCLPIIKIVFEYMFNLGLFLGKYLRYL